MSSLTIKKSRRNIDKPTNTQKVRGKGINPGAVSLQDESHVHSTIEVLSLFFKGTLKMFEFCFVKLYAMENS